MSLRLLTLLAVLIVAIVWVFTNMGPQSRFMGFDKEFQAGYAQLQLGEKKDGVFELFGEPRRSSDQCCLPQLKGFEEVFKRAENSSSLEFHLWVNGGNWYYCIGFDEDGKLAFKGEGHS